MKRPSNIFRAVLLWLCLESLTKGIFAHRSVLSLSNWAKDHGVTMHPSIKWKDNGDQDWGLQLTSKVDRGTVLIKVPRSLVLDSAAIKEDILQRDGEQEVAKCIAALGPFAAQHEENFWIVLRLYRYQLQKDARFAPWLAALPQTFPKFSPAEIECLPFYAKYIAEYQQQKFQKFCQAAAATLGELDKNQKEQFEWAFNCVGSRFWKTESTLQENYQPRSELVPIGDMFNHRDPPNVKFTHDQEDDSVCFIYLGDNDNDEEEGQNSGEECYPKDLFITYGQPYNPHRFLMIFGFVPTDSMKEMWSHLILSETNPYASDVSKMVFGCKDGSIPQHLWDAVLHELDPAKGIEVLRESTVANQLATDVLNNHVTKQLDELSALREKMDAIEGGGENMGIIRGHNEFLTNVFEKVRANLQEKLGKNTM